MNAVMIDAMRERIRAAAAAGVGLRFRGGGSKSFYGRQPVGEVVDMRAYSGIVSYEPTELVVTVKAGTPLAELEALLAEHGQMLAFEPPHFGDEATVGGCVAAGLSGPRRLAAGPLRDFVLGVQILDGRGDLLSFGGQVMKNVAGYDVARLMAGSLGTLGLLLEISLKVLPRPAAETTLRFELDQAQAIARLNEWGGQPVPLSASVWRAAANRPGARGGGELLVRLSGAQAAVGSAVRRLGGDRVADDRVPAGWVGWADLREQRDAFFNTASADTPLWRLAVPSDTPPLPLDGAQLIEWGGGLRWFRGEMPEAAIRSVVEAAGGHASLFRGGDRSGAVFHPLAPAALAIHRRLKQSFDPAGVFNPGRMYDGV